MIKILYIVLALSLSIYASGSDININQLNKQANKENKHTLIFFHMDYCPYCEKMIEESFEDEKTKDQLKKDFIVIDINVDDEENIIFNDFKGDKSKFAKELDISFYPTVLFLDNEDYVAYTLKGYREKEVFQKVLKFIKSKSYEDMDFSEYTD